MVAGHNTALAGLSRLKQRLKMIDTLARQLENRLRAQYLATEIESDLINWVEAGIIRHAIEEMLTKQVKQKYSQNTPDWFVKAK